MFCNTNFDNPFFISKKSLNQFINKKEGIKNNTPKTLLADTTVVFSFLKHKKNIMLKLSKVINRNIFLSLLKYFQNKNLLSFILR